MNEFNINNTPEKTPHTPYSSGVYSLDKIGVTNKGRNINATLLAESFNVFFINAFSRMLKRILFISKAIFLG